MYRERNTPFAHPETKNFINKKSPLICIGGEKQILVGIFSKNIILLKKQHKKDGIICEHITPPMAIFYILSVSHSLTNRSGIVFTLGLGLFLYFIVKASQIIIYFESKKNHSN